jgi:hypothetical protein
MTPKFILLSFQFHEELMGKRPYIYKKSESTYLCYSIKTVNTKHIAVEPAINQNKEQKIGL